jgi:hypothetical protein
MVAVLVAYFDESYNHRTEKNPDVKLVYTVAGWISTVEKWQEFGKEWRQALRDARITDFHMKDYETRQGVYEDWITNKRLKVLRRLHRLIKHYTLFGFNASVHKTAFDEIMTPEAKKNIGKTPYGFDVRLCLRQIGFWADKNKVNEPIHYVFAHLNKQGGELDWIFETCLNDPKVKDWFRMNAMWTKAFAKDVGQLQAADIFAYEINKHVVNYVSRGERPTRKSFLNLYYGQKFTDPMYFGRKELTEWVSRF